MLAFIVIALYTGTFLLDFLPDIKKRRKFHSAVYCILFLISFCVLILYSFDIVIPGPYRPIKNIVEAFFPPKK